MPFGWSLGGVAFGGKVCGAPQAHLGYLEMDRTFFKCHVSSSLATSVEQTVLALWITYIACVPRVRGNPIASTGWYGWLSGIWRRIDCPPDPCG